MYLSKFETILFICFTVSELELGVSAFSVCRVCRYNPRKHEFACLLGNKFQRIVE